MPEAVRVLVKPAVIFALSADVAANHKQKLFRPTVVAMLENAQQKLLLLKSTKGNIWSFLQGGVDLGEHIIDALTREVRQEVGIEVVEVRKFCYADHREIPDRQRDGFTVGKRYYYFHALCEGTPELVLQTEEVAEAEWLSLIAVDERISALGEPYADKRKSMLTALRKLGRS